MPTPTYDLLATSSVSSQTASITFNSLGNYSSYRDLIIIGNYSATQSGPLYIRLNSDTGSNYDAVRMSGDGTNFESSAFTNSSAGIFTSNGQNTLTGFEIVFFDFNQTNKHKHYNSRSSDPQNRVSSFSGVWKNTNAMTSIQIGSFFYGDLKAGSTFQLFGRVA